jgi:hypothetical protein
MNYLSDGKLLLSSLMVSPVGKSWGQFYESVSAIFDGQNLGRVFVFTAV